MTQDAIDEMASLRLKGFTFADIGKRLRCSERTARRYVGNVMPQLRLPQANADTAPELVVDARTLREGFITKFLDVLYNDEGLRGATTIMHYEGDDHWSYEYGLPPSTRLLAEAEHLLRKRFATMGDGAVRLLARDKRAEPRFLREVVGDLRLDYINWHHCSQNFGSGGIGEDWRPLSERPSVEEPDYEDPYGFDDRDCRMSPEEFRAKWRTEAEALRRRHAIVDGAELCAEILADFDAVVATEMEAALNLQEAAAESGYSPDHLGALIRQGKIPNAGRPKAPRIRRQDLPRKTSRLRPSPPTFRLLGATPGQIARAVVDSTKGATR